MTGVNNEFLCACYISLKGCLFFCLWYNTKFMALLMHAVNTVDSLDCSYHWLLTVPYSSLNDAAMYWRSSIFLWYIHIYVSLTPVVYLVWSDSRIIISSSTWTLVLVNYHDGKQSPWIITCCCQVFGKRVSSHVQPVILQKTSRNYLVHARIGVSEFKFRITNDAWSGQTRGVFRLL